MEKLRRLIIHRHAPIIVRIIFVEAFFFFFLSVFYYGTTHHDPPHGFVSFIILNYTYERACCTDTCTRVLHLRRANRAVDTTAAQKECATSAYKLKRCRRTEHRKQRNRNRQRLCSDSCCSCCRNENSDERHVPCTHAQYAIINIIQ